MSSLARAPSTPPATPLGIAWARLDDEAVATSDVENVETAANHLYAHGFVERGGRAVCAVTGTVNFLGTPTYLAVIGGTGAYAASSGQCTLYQRRHTTDSWSCDIQ